MKLRGWMDGCDGMGKVGRGRFSSVCCFRGKEAEEAGESRAKQASRAGTVSR